MSVRDLRKDYQLGSLTEETAGNDPFVLFREWLEAAVAAEVPEPNAMTVCTVDQDGQPAARILLLRDYGPDGLQFFTNYLSRKGREIAASPRVSLLFFWPLMERQIRIEGTVAKTSSEASDAYFNSRPYESRLGAHASLQSETIAGPEVLTKRMEELRKQYPTDVPRPEHWGGYNLVPQAFEFWQGRPSRLHDRIRFNLTEGTWSRRRLSP